MRTNMSCMTQFLIAIGFICWPLWILAILSYMNDKKQA